MLPYVPGTPFLGRGENPLIPEDCDRIVFAGIFACDRAETLRRNSGGDLAIGSGNDAIDGKALVVAEQRGNVVAVHGRIEFDHAIASRVVHVDDVGSSRRGVRVEAEVVELLGPVRVGIPQALDVDPAREASLDRGLDELGSEEREREREIDLPFGALFALCQLRGVSD